MKLPLYWFVGMKTKDSENARTASERLIQVVLLLLIFIIAARTPLDSDMWWHLRSGEVTWQTGQVLTRDIFSFTRMNMPWTNHSWLSQVGMYLLYRAGGAFALGGVVALLATISMGLTLAQMEAPALVKSVVTIIATLVTAWVWSPRPQLTSLVLFSLVAYLLYLYKWKSINRLWSLPIIFVLWSNLHAGYTLGLILIGTLIAGECLNHCLGFTGQEILPFRKIGFLIGWGVICGLVVLINPNGIRTWLVPFQTVGIQSLQNFVSEWASPDFHVIGQQALLWLVFLCLTAIGLSNQRLDGYDLVAMVVFGYSAFLARRNFGPFALIAAPILARHLWSAIQCWWERIEPRLVASSTILARIYQRVLTGLGKSSKVNPLFNLGIVAFLTLAAVFKLYVVTYPPLVSIYEGETNPVKAVEWIEHNQPTGNLLNSYDWGGYLIWKMRDFPVFIDGRTDLYNDEIIGQWMCVVNAGQGWQEVLDHWNIHLILVEPDRPVVALLTENGWHKAYQDNLAVVFTR